MMEFKDYVKANRTNNSTTEYLQEFFKRTKDKNSEQISILAKRYVQPIISCCYMNQVTFKEVIDALNSFDKKEKDILFHAICDSCSDLIY